jgi:hypothetical protein
MEPWADELGAGEVAAAELELDPASWVAPKELVKEEGRSDIAEEEVELRLITFSEVAE